MRGAWKEFSPPKTQISTYSLEPIDRPHKPLVFVPAFSKLRPMRLFSYRRLAGVLVVFGLVSPAFPQADLANLREDVRDLSQRLGALSLKVEQLERENHELRGKAGSVERNFATVFQLNEAIADLNRNLKSAIASSKTETLQQVGVQMEKLANATNVALDSLAKVQATRPTVPAAAPTFTNDFPKDSVSYTVQKGDSLALIAKKTGAKQADIINANKISDPSRIQPGQTLIVPVSAPTPAAK
jgi:LysM repeat protein